MADKIDKLAFLTPSKAVKRIEPSIGSSVVAKMEIAERLKDGRLQAYAEEMWTAEGRRWRTAFREGPSEADLVVRSHIIKASVWRSSNCWAEDTCRWE